MSLASLLEDSSAKPEALRYLDDVSITYPMQPDPCLKIACRAILFFEGGALLEKRAEAYRILADYAVKYRSKLSHVQHAANVNPHITPIKWDSLAAEGEAAVQSVPSEKDCEVGFFGPPFDASTGGISQFGASLVASKPDQLMPVDISYIEFSISHASLIERGFDDYLSMVADACNRLKPLHGLAGPSIQFDRIYSSTTGYVASLPLVRRFPGLHCSRDDSFRVEVQDFTNRRIFTTNWLTIVSDAVLGQSDEALKAVSNLPSSCTAHKYEGGVVLRAGSSPQLGDVNRGLLLTDYQDVARALKPIRFEDYKLGLLDVEQPLDMLEETLKWIRRFD